MDWSTVAMSAGVSAVVGTFFSLLAASTVTVRQQRAIVREQALKEIRLTVERELGHLGRYRFTSSRASAERSDNSIPSNDMQLVIEVRRAARSLSRPRRWAIDRRLTKIYGGWLVGLVRDYPSGIESPGSAVMPLWLAGSFHRPPTEDSTAPWRSLMHTTYSKPPNGGTGKTLQSQLRKLAAAR